jgi:8-oxo-dGTP diphosphatase
VIVSKGTVLLIRRRITEGELSWQFPAGKVEPGEAAEGAAVRETFEETGLTVRVIEHLGERVHPTTGRTIVYVACEVLAGTAHAAAGEEVAEVEWCDRAALATRVAHTLHRPVQDYLDARLA